MSPCVGVCLLDEANSMCLGCGRTRDEVARWPKMTRAEQDAVWRALEERRGDDPARHHLLPWDENNRRVAVEASLSVDAHSWAIGTWGAVAEFHRNADEPFEMHQTETGFEAATPRGAIRIERIEKARAFLGVDESTVSFAVHKARVERTPSTVITDLGADAGAVNAADRGARLFDLGLGQPHMKLCVRTAGSRPDRRPRGRDRVCPVRSARGAAETPEGGIAASGRAVGIGPCRVYQPVGEHGAETPEGPHTHLLPKLLAEKRCYGPDLALPATYFPALYLYRSGPPANGRTDA